MKRLITVLLVTVLAFSCKENATKKIKQENLKVAKERDYKLAEGAPVMKFDKTSYDFGNINEGDVVETTFNFENTGKSALIITNASSSCGCTIPKWPKEPVAPGEKGEILVKFNSNGKHNKQTKTVTLVTNTAKGKEMVVITADVTPKPKNS